MAVSMLRAGGRLWTVERWTNHSRSSASIKRQSLRFPSPRGWAGTYPSRAQRIRVRLSIRMRAAASVASRIRISCSPTSRAGFCALADTLSTSFKVLLRVDFGKNEPKFSMGNQLGSRPIKVGSGVIPGGYDGLHTARSCHPLGTLLSGRRAHERD